MNLSHRFDWSGLSLRCKSELLFMCESMWRRQEEKMGDIWLWKDLICTFRKSKKSRLSWLPLLYNRSRFVPVCRRCLSLHHRTKFPNWDIRNASTNSTPDFLLSFLATAKKQFQFFFLFNVFQRTCLPEGRRSVYSAKTNQQAHSIRWWLYNG